MSKLNLLARRKYLLFCAMPNLLYINLKEEKMETKEYQDIYIDGAHWDEMESEKRDDIPFFQKQIEKFGGPVLEIGCGTGRVTIHLAKMNVKITGIDNSKSMLEQARKKASFENLDINFINSDMRYFNIDKRFKTIVSPYNSLSHVYEIEDIHSLLLKVKEHLEPDGVFIFELFNPGLNGLAKSYEKSFSVSEYEDPATGKCVRMEEKTCYDRATQINQMFWYFYSDGKNDRGEKVTQRVFFPQEIDAHLYYNGFEIIHKYGDYDESPFLSESRKQIFICKKK
jgi:ubiquinone/menaquinone biosynthesis C-methylase UbiE